MVHGGVIVRQIITAIIHAGPELVNDVLVNKELHFFMSSISV